LWYKGFVLDGEGKVNKREVGPSRRGFLKASGLAAVGTVLYGENSGSAAVTEEPAGKPRELADFVNVMQGVDSSPEFSRGGTLPIAALPFGMAHWTLQSNAKSAWMFHPRDRRIQGLRCTHQLSTWLDDYGYATFLPICGDVRPEAGPRSSSYDVEGAKLSPYSLQFFLLRYRAHVEMIPTERCGLLSASFEKTVAAKPTGLVVDVPASNGAFQKDENKRTLRFTSTANKGGVPDNFATYYVLRFADAWETFEEKQEGSNLLGTVRFRPGQDVTVRIATSFISYEQAERNLAKELGELPAASLRAAAAATWNDHLGRIEIEGATNDQSRLFYSCMYRALLFPRTFHEPDANGDMHHYSAFNGKVTPGVMYADHGYWDVYRAWYPLMSIFFPDRLGEILQAWVNAYKEGGWLPQFPCPGYRACMTGSLIDAVFGDAAVKGIAGFDLEQAYEGLKKHATTPGDPAKGYGRTGIEQYLKLHYIPADQIEQSVAETVDAAYGDFCIAQVAKKLGKEDDASAFMKRSEYWRNVFDSGVKFFRGKNHDGSWLAPFDPVRWGSPFVEGSAWQHRWDAPHNVPGLIEVMGGKTSSAAALEEMVQAPPIFDVGFYKSEIHEMSEMAAVPFGQYAQSNQPSHHMLYLCVYAGRSDLTQYWARKVMQELYTADAFPGDEDTGSMSAWFVLSALGFYPVCPGKPEYTLGSPLFRRATLHLPGTKTFVIEAPGNTKDTMFVRDVTFNGAAFSGPALQHSTLIAGGTLRFEMAAKRPV
jgi:predicted alpha-1,2-mannosidase